MKVIFHMNGQFVFKNAVVRFRKLLEGLNANNLQVSDIDMLVPSSQFKNFNNLFSRNLNYLTIKFLTFKKHGNTTAASIPIALTEASKQN
jgi:3-oxoacyl-[acyl-carrier-protein] synthase-3